MSAIKGVVTKKKEVVTREIPTLINGFVKLLKDTIEVEVDVRTYYTEKHKKYDEIVYNSQEGGRLFDNEEQAIKAGFVKAK